MMTREPDVRIVNLIMLLAPLALADAAAAQPTPMEPTPDLTKLESFVGEWRRESGETLLASEPTEGRLRVGRGPGEVWFTWEAALRFGEDSEIHGRWHFAWDDRDETYRWSWIDTQSARIHHGTATWVDGSTLELLEVPFVWPDGTEFTFKMSFRVIGDRIEESVWQSANGGPMRLVNEAVWRRVAA